MMRARLGIGEMESLLQKYRFNDSMPNFDQVWKANSSNKRSEEAFMAEGKGGFKIVVWLVSFMFIAAVGWFGLTKFSTMKKQEKIEKGEAIVATLVVGDVSVMKMGSTSWRKVLVEDTLQMGDTVKTGNDSYCELQMVKRGIFRVESASELFLEKLVNVDEKITSRMKLAKGGVALKPKKLAEGENFEVETSTAVAAVRGTKFMVNVDESGNTKVSVNEGKVAVSPVLNSIKDANEKGLVDDKASELLKKELVKPIEVTPGEEATMNTAKVKALDKAIGQVIENVAKQEGGTITAETMAAAPVDTATKDEKGKTEMVKMDMIAQMQNAIPVAAGNTNKGADSALAGIMVKQQISEEVKAKLDELSEAKIIDKALDMVKIRFDAKPAGADIYVDDVKIGVSPTEMIIDKGKKVVVKVMKDGFNDLSKDVVVNDNMTLNLQLAEIPVAVNTNLTAAVTNTNEIAAAEINQEIKKVAGDLDWEKEITVNFDSGDNEPVLSKERIIVTVNNQLVILSLEGKVLKKVSVVEEGFKLTRPSVGDGNIYVGSDNGGLYAYSYSGELNWKKDAGSQKYGASPEAGYGYVAVPSIDKGIKIYTKAGELYDSIDLSIPIYAAPLLVNEGKTLIYATESGEVVSYDLPSKSKKWTKSYNERFLYPLVGNDTTVVTLARNSGKVMGISVADGSVKWNNQFAEIQKTKINPQYTSGKIILANNNEKSTVIVLSASSGKVVSRTSLDGIITMPFLTGDNLYFGTASGKVLCYNLNDSKNLWTFKSTGKGISLVVADKEGIYAVSQKAMYKLVK